MRTWRSIHHLLIDTIFPPRDSELIVRSLPDEALADLISPNRLSEETSETNATFLLQYENPQVQACVLEAKFHGNRRAAQLLAYALASYLQKAFLQSTAASNQIVLLPIPLSRSRMRERGYNQTERIARGAAARIGEIMLDTSLLVRTRNTAPQTTLSGAARRKNILGAFTTTHPCDSALTYILLDDVTTTGSTLSDAARALRAAGAASIISLALAH